MSAKTVTEKPAEEGTGREAVLRAMQEASKSVAGKKGVPRGPQGTKRIVILPNDKSWSSPGDKKNKKWFDEDEEDEGSESSSIHPRNLSYLSTTHKRASAKKSCQAKESCLATKGQR